MAKNPLLNENGTVRPAAFYTLIALVLAGGAYGAYRVYYGAEQPIGFLMMCTTPDCGHTTSVQLAVGTPIPAPCSKCGKEGLTPAYKCVSCGTVNVWNNYRGVSERDRCSKCNTEVKNGL